MAELEDWDFNAEVAEGSDNGMAPIGAGDRTLQEQISEGHPRSVPLKRHIKGAAKT